MRERTDETRSIGGKTPTGAVQATPSFPKDRVCSHGGCYTQLSIYNDGNRCALHLARVVPRTRGRRVSDSLGLVGLAQDADERSARSVLPTNQPLIAGQQDSPDCPIVLVVDDDPDVGEDTAVNLRRAGLRVRTALTTEHACDFCKAQPVDAVVLEHRLADSYSDHLLDGSPDMGLAVIVPDGMPNLLADIHKSYGQREFAVLIKPVLPAELVEVVQEAITECHHLRTMKAQRPPGSMRPALVAKDSIQSNVKAPHHGPLNRQRVRAHAGVSTGPEAATASWTVRNRSGPRISNGPPEGRGADKRHVAGG